MNAGYLLDLTLRQFSGTWDFAFDDELRHSQEFTPALTGLPIAER